MSTLAEIEAAADTLPAEEKKALLHFLSVRLRDETNRTREAHSVLDVPPLSVGRILHPLSADDDLLGEMLEDRV